MFMLLKTASFLKGSRFFFNLFHKMDYYPKFRNRKKMYFRASKSLCVAIEKKLIILHQ